MMNRKIVIFDQTFDQTQDKNSNKIKNNSNKIKIRSATCCTHDQYFLIVFGKLFYTDGLNKFLCDLCYL